MEPSPLVSVNVPTLNSARTLGATLDSVLNQSHRDIEIILIDNGSDDGTIDIAKDFGAKILFNDRALLESRCLGIEASRGTYTLLLDSDQVLSPDTLTRAIDAMPGLDYLFLEESSVPSPGQLESVLGSDKIRVNQGASSRSASRFQQALPRFFRSAVLKSAISQIPMDVRLGVVLRDHAVLNFEVLKLTDRAGWLSKAVHHHENPDLIAYLIKQRRYGCDDRILWRHNRYRPLVAANIVGRVALSSGVKASRPIGTVALAALRAPAYLTGIACPGGEVRHKHTMWSNEGKD